MDVVDGGRIDETDDENEVWREFCAIGFGLPAALAGLELGGTGADLPIGSPARSIRVFRFSGPDGGGIMEGRALFADAVIS